MRLKECDLTNIDEVISTSDTILIHFGTDWCAPCKRLERVLIQLQTEGLLTVSVVKVNVEDEPDIAKRFSVTKNPTLCLVKNGELANSQVGYADAEAVLSFVG